MSTRLLLAAAIACATLYASLAYAESTSSSDPGFVPDTGQINPGTAPHPWSAAAGPLPIAEPAEVRAALLMPDPGTISLGEQAAANGKAQPETTGKGNASGEQPGPIGSTMQTKPAKFSHRNDVLDHTLTMGTPLLLDAQQRKQVFQAVMAQKTPAPAGTHDFKPADIVPYSLSTQIHPLPDSTRDISDLAMLAYMKGNDKIYLVTTRTADPIVVDILDGR